jgi:Protein of unknown function (DUF1579)
MAAETKQKNAMDKQAMMEVYHKLAKPGAPHKLLASMAGSWRTRTKAWMEPSQPPMETAGTCDQKMMLGGRYLCQEFAGDMMGTPFNGIGFMGYDNHKQRYVSTWMDSMSTGIFFFEGTADAGGRSITQTCVVDDPVRGLLKWRTVTKIVDENTHLFEMFSTDKSDKEEKMMEITYTRK